MGNQNSSVSISSTPKPDNKLKGVLVPKEEEERNNNLKQVSPHEIVSEKTIITEKQPNNNLGVLKTKSDLMKKYPQNDEISYICGHCNTKFSSTHALGGHLNSHIKNQDFQSQVMNLESNHSSGLFFGKYSQDLLPNDHNGFMNMTPLHGSFIGNTSYDHFGLPLGLIKPKEEDDNVCFSFGPFKSTGVSSNNDNVNGGTIDMNTTVIRPKASYPFFTDKTSYGSSSCDPLPYCNYPRTTMFPLQENDLGSSYFENLISKGKNITMECEADDDDDVNKVIEDNDKIQIEEAEAKSWGHDLSLSI